MTYGTRSADPAIVAPGSSIRPNTQWLRLNMTVITRLSWKNNQAHLLQIARYKYNLLVEQIIVLPPPFNSRKSTTDFIVSNRLVGTQHYLRLTQLRIKKRIKCVAVQVCILVCRVFQTPSIMQLWIWSYHLMRKTLMLIQHLKRRRWPISHDRGTEEMFLEIENRKSMRLYQHLQQYHLQLLMLLQWSTCWQIWTVNNFENLI